MFADEPLPDINRNNPYLFGIVVDAMFSSPLSPLFLMTGVA